MLMGLLKMLSGLLMLCKPRACKPRAKRGPLIRDNSDLNDLLERIRKTPTKQARADYPTCDVCGAFLVRESSRFTCRDCAEKRIRHGHALAQARPLTSGVELSLPLDCPVAPGGQTPREIVRLDLDQAEILSRRLLKPGSANLSIENDITLTVAWRLVTRDVRITVWTGDKCDVVLDLTVAQAARLGEDIAGCVGIVFLDAPGCDHEFVDARNEYVASGELCVKCGAIRP